MQYTTVNNSIITLGDTDDSGKGRHFKSRFIQPGLAGYPGQYGNALIRKETLDKFVHTLRNKPVIINHKSEITEDDKVGEVFNVWFNADDGWYWCDGVIYDRTAQNLIKDRGWSVSCSYNYTDSAEGGTENNVPYDIEFLDGEFDHLAIVENPRYERANIVFNSKELIKNSLISAIAKDVNNDNSSLLTDEANIIIPDISENLNPNVKEYDMEVNNSWVTLKDKEGEPYHVELDDKEEKENPQKTVSKTAAEYKDKLAELRKKYKILDSDNSSALRKKQYHLAHEYRKYIQDDTDRYDAYGRYKDKEKEKIELKIKNLIGEIERTASFRFRQEEKNGLDHGQISLFNSKSIKDIINNAIITAITENIINQYK